MKHVVEKPVFFIPEPGAFIARVIHRVRDVDEVLPEFAGDIFIDRIFFRQLHRNCQQVERIHRHPARAI